jgi:hypothetical protein
MAKEITFAQTVQSAAEHTVYLFLKYECGLSLR